MEKEEKRFIVYMHKFPNEKMYIGITSKTPKKRWSNGKGYNKKKQPVMYNAILKYGWDNVEHIILSENLLETEAKKKEIELIKYYNTYCHSKNSNGYNMTFGGEGCLGHRNKENVTIANKKRMTGKTGDLCPNSKSVICGDNRYESITEFCKIHNLGRAMVERWLKGEVNMPQKWFDLKLRLEFGEDKTTNTPQSKSWSNLIEYDGIAYESQAEFSKEIGVAKATVCNWLSGKTRIPKEIYDKLIIPQDEKSRLKVLHSPVIKEIEYDGKTYHTQIELANFLNVKKATLNSWLKGKNKMPIEHKINGLKYHNK